MAITVLVADDHCVLRDGLRRLLEVDGRVSVVGVAGDGVEAIDETQRLRPDVVLMDITMPRLDGIEATRTIVERLPQTGVAILSMHSSIDLVRQALSVGARAFLLKESTGDEVVAAVSAVAAGDRYLGRGISITDLDLRCDVRPYTATLRNLTAAEREVLKLVADGKSNAEAARVLGLSPRTVEAYRGRLMEKLQLDNLPALVRFAIRHGLSSID